MANGTPTYIDHYQILKTLGSGGFGTVYLARDDKLRREVVLKVLHANWASDPQMRTRFMREARAMARLKHPNIVTVYAVEDGTQQPYIFDKEELGSSFPCQKRYRFCARWRRLLFSPPFGFRNVEYIKFFVPKPEGWRNS